MSMKPRLVPTRFCQAGFTLIEIMVVLGIVGMVAILAIPNLTLWLSQYQLKQAVSEIVADLNMAKFIAMNRNRQATVTIQLVGATVQVRGLAGGAEIIPAKTFMGSVNGLPGGTATVNFSSMGMSTATTPQTIQLQNNKGLVYAVSVLPSGKVNWCPKASCP
ncbi:MAG: prepilin-type N-terminal cleavage/methylation domain-containing protein [Nitrospira sp.]|nr:prepilin-type N-terminal cleavage/methylation domain-containing protein [Nitrospira sp.]